MKHYTGNKNIPGVIELLVNNLPKSKRYFSLFFGGGGLKTSKYTNDAFFICSEKNKDCLWLNYKAASIELLNYDALGSNFIERQAIKRQRKNIIEKFKRLETHTRQKILLDIKKEFNI